MKRKRNFMFFALVWAVGLTFILLEGNLVGKFLFWTGVLDLTIILTAYIYLHSSSRHAGIFAFVQGLFLVGFVHDDPVRVRHDGFHDNPVFPGDFLIDGMERCDNRNPDKTELGDQRKDGDAEMSPEEPKFVLDVNHVGGETGHHLKGLLGNISILVVEGGKDFVTGTAFVANHIDIGSLFPESRCEVLGIRCDTAFDGRKGRDKTDSHLHLRI